MYLLSVSHQLQSNGVALETETHSSHEEAAMQSVKKDVHVT